MKATLTAFLGAAVLVLQATPCVSEGLHGRTREDGDHRYLLEVTVAQSTPVAGTTLGMRFCLSPAEDERLEVCLGRHQGHWFHSGNTRTARFTLDPEDDAMCRCERPVVLTRAQPVCWSMDALLLDADAGSTAIGGFVTVLEDAHETGRTADSCINVRSVMMPITIEPKKTDEAAPVEAGTGTHT